MTERQIERDIESPTNVASNADTEVVFDPSQVDLSQVALEYIRGRIRRESVLFRSHGSLISIIRRSDRSLPEGLTVKVERRRSSGD